MRVILYVAAVAALMPVAALIRLPLSYPLLILALTLLFDRNAFATLGLVPRMRVGILAVAGIIAGVTLNALRAFTLSSVFDAEVRFDFSSRMLLFMLGSVLVEELWFRGYGFKLLAATRGVTVAMVAFALAFAVYHWVQWNMWGKPVAMAAALVSTGLAHVFFALAFLKSGTMWLPIGLHFGWNVGDGALRLVGVPQTTAAFLTGFAVSQLLLAAAIAVTIVSPPRGQALIAAPVDN